MSHHLRASLVLAATAAVIAPALGAQITNPTRRITAGLAVSVATPAGELANFAGSGYAIEALVQSAGARGVGLRGEVGYASLAGDRVTVAGVPFEAPDTRILSGVISAVLAPGGGRVVKPYLIGGVGIYNFDYGDADDADDVNEFAIATDVGLNAGVGIRFPLGPLNTFAEARFHNVFSADEPTRFFAPIKVGITF